MSASKPRGSRWERAQALVDASTEDFANLILIAGLDPKRHLRFSDWSGVSFGGCDLRGFDFTGARLLGCIFEGALVSGARFDQAELDCARPDAQLDPKRTQLSSAKDWDPRPANWRRPFAHPSDSHLPIGAVFQDAPFAPELVVVPAGAFMMGTSPDEIAALTKEHGENYGKFVNWEGPRHPVTIAQPFAVGRFPVTFEEWDVFAKDQRRKVPDDEKWGRGRRPVINVSWDDVKAYCDWLSERTGKPYRLLTEAEWEYCCRAGAETRYGFGDEAGKLGDYAWFDANSGKNTHPVGEKLSNGFGLHDMHGNVWEWCQDAFVENYDNAPDNDSAVEATGKSVSRVLRGGSWNYNPHDLRAALRGRDLPDLRSSLAGFRLARTLIP